MKNILTKIQAFLKEVKTELKKVNWSNRQETIKYTLIVIIVLVLVATYLGAIDFFFSRLLNRLIQ